MVMASADSAVTESIRSALIQAGFVDAASGDFVSDPRILAGCLIAGRRQIMSIDPWSEPFAMMIRADWRNIDGDTGDVQMRVTENGVQLRERTPATPACIGADHLVQTCEDCWTIHAIEPSERWHPVTTRIQVRVNEALSNTTGGHRVEVRRRMSDDATQPEAVWSEPWELPDYMKMKSPESDWNDPNRTWVDATPEGDIQVSTGHTFPRGILVRRATGREDAPWMTPTFLEETHWQWADLLPDGSVQFRCWRTLEKKESYGRYRIELRQRIGRKPVFAVEPVWSESKTSHGRACRTNGYELRFLYSRHSHRDIIGLHVIDPYGGEHRVMVTDRDVMVGPDLRVNASYQGWFYWWNSIAEPQAETVNWSMPQERLLRSREWTLLNEGTVRAKIVNRSRRGVRIEILQSESVRRHWWSLRRSPWVSDGVKSFGSAHDLTSTLRVTFRLDQVAEIQSVTPTTV